MKKNWTTPITEELDMKETAYKAEVTNSVDAYVYDSETGQPVFNLGYNSGQAAR